MNTLPLPLLLHPSIEDSLNARGVCFDTAPSDFRVFISFNSYYALELQEVATSNGLSNLIHHQLGKKPSDSKLSLRCYLSPRTSLQAHLYFPPIESVPSMRYSKHQKRSLEHLCIIRFLLHARGAMGCLLNSKTD